MSPRIVPFKLWIFSSNCIEVSLCDRQSVYLRDGLVCGAIPSDRISNVLLIILTSKAKRPSRWSVMPWVLRPPVNVTSKLKRICWEMRGKLPLLQIGLINLEQFYFFNASSYGKNTIRRIPLPFIAGVHTLVCQRNVKTEAICRDANFNYIELWSPLVSRNIIYLFRN